MTANQTAVQTCRLDWWMVPLRWALAGNDHESDAEEAAETHLERQRAAPPGGGATRRRWQQCFHPVLMLSDSSHTHTEYTGCNTVTNHQQQQQQQQQHSSSSCCCCSFVPATSAANNRVHEKLVFLHRPPSSTRKNSYVGFICPQLHPDSKSKLTSSCEEVTQGIAARMS